MIARTAGSLLGWYAPRRLRAIGRAARSMDEFQERTLRRLVTAARDTEFGRAHAFADIRSIADYQARVPVRDYFGFHRLFARTLHGERDVVWPGRPRYWVTTSGTTAGDKLIPVTPDAFASHRRGGWDALVLATARVGAHHLFAGHLLFLGGSTALGVAGAGCRVGDLSGLVVRRLPPGIRGRASPGPRIAAIKDWERRLDAIAAQASRQDVRLIAGMPSWVLILLERVARRSGTDVARLWPNLDVFVHGGMAFAPYREAFDRCLGRPVQRIEVYSASEGFIALQTELGDGLSLMVDYGIFYEFVPVEDLGLERPRRHTVDEVELGRLYAVILTTPAGLWSYLLGDTVRFVARDPLRLRIAGRTRHYVNAFGENVIVEEVEQALVAACRRTGADVVEFTVAPHVASALAGRGRHDWLVEFRVEPRSRAEFIRAVDVALASLNADYRQKRLGDVGMVAPRLVDLPAGTFHGWMRRHGKLGDQHKVPRVSNDRTAAEELLALASPTRREVVIPG